MLSRHAIGSPAAILAAGAIAIGITFATGPAFEAAAIPETPEPVAQPCVNLPVGSTKWKQCRERNGLPTASRTADEALVLGYALAKEGKLQEALEFLRPLEDRNDPRILTYIGFAERKLGRIDAAMGYYQRALTLDPLNVATREYLGEAYLQQGNLNAARMQLAEIEKLCGSTCEAYTTLANAIEQHPNVSEPSPDKLERAAAQSVERKS